ncbi:MAG: hypothetical protein ACLQFR_07580 [Streptosporangiaceae bacterium]
MSALRAQIAAQQIEAPTGHHLHLHGITAADVAAAITRQDADRVYGTLDKHPAIEE